VPDVPIGGEPPALLLDVLARLRPDESRDVRLQLLPALVVEAIIPRAQERADDLARALRVVGVLFAGDEGDCLHHAHALLGRVML
jgi:hypothetical protein